MNERVCCWQICHTHCDDMLGRQRARMSDDPLRTGCTSLEKDSAEKARRFFELQKEMKTTHRENQVLFLPNVDSTAL